METLPEPLQQGKPFPGGEKPFPEGKKSFPGGKKPFPGVENPSWKGKTLPTAAQGIQELPSGSTNRTKREQRMIPEPEGLIQLNLISPWKRLLSPKLFPALSSPGVSLGLSETLRALPGRKRSHPGKGWDQRGWEWPGSFPRETRAPPNLP